MGDLAGFFAYLDERTRLLVGVERRLCTLQEKYENHFAEIDKVREAELGQLAAIISSRRSELPGEFLEKLDREHRRQEQVFAEKLAALETACSRLRRQAEALRRKSLAAEKKLHRSNRELDDREEALKARQRELLDAIAEFNRRIRELAGGFGFFKNLPVLRRLQRQKQVLEEQQQDLAARIEQLRERWRRLSEKGAEAERRRRQRWLALSTEADARRAKLEYLEQQRLRIVDRSALEAVLFELEPPPRSPADGDPACSRCGMKNPPGNHFCHVCALRLAGDRPDFQGSLEEVAELNHHHRRFSTGMRTCQELIGLVRGVISGLQAMSKSVSDMMDSQSRHNLGTLVLDVPRTCLDYGRVFDELERLLQVDQAWHPADFAARVEKLVEQRLGEKQLKNYFETMGRELGRQADLQW